MGHVRVHGADLEGGRIRALRVKIHGLPPRTIDRDTAIHWMREGHSLVPVVDGAESTALQLVEVPEGDEVKRFVRADNTPTAEDALPKLPPVAEAQGLIRALAMLFLAGCPKPVPVDWAQAPRLPSPQSPTYQRDPAESADPAVADVAKGKQWDTHLSGGGTAPALTAAKGTAPLSPWELREDVWRAGYPYPIEEVKLFIGVPEAPPPQELLTWLLTVTPDEDLGLVRARSAMREAWVGLVSKPRINLGVVPRAVDLGATLTLPGLVGGRYRIADANGNVLEDALDGGYTRLLDSEGEWVIQISDPKGVIAWFPLYVGISPPLENLFPPAPTPLGSDAEVADLLERYLAMLRDAYGSSVWRRDLILDATARRLLADPNATVTSELRHLGVAEPHFVWSCTAASVEACLDAIVWDPEQRRPLLLPEYTNIGVATSVEGGKARIRIVLSGG